MVARGRGRNKIHCGELNGNAKLTQEEAEQIRALSATETQRALAKRFGVSRATVSYIVNGMRYAA
jgi:transcriptional regulator with XRE-family HTH domain